MIDQLLNEIEAAKASLQEWQNRQREAHDQVQRGLGYLQALGRVLELAEAAAGEQKEDAGSEPPTSEVAI